MWPPGLFFIFGFLFYTGSHLFSSLVFPRFPLFAKEKWVIVK